MSTRVPVRIELRWSKYSKLTEARTVFPHQACVYVQADKHGRPVRVGKASKGLDERYHGGNGYSMDAAMHESGNLVFVAPVDAALCKAVPVDAALCKAVEDELIRQGRRVLTHNNQGKLTPPRQRIVIELAPAVTCTVTRAFAEP